MPEACAARSWPPPTPLHGPASSSCSDVDAARGPGRGAGPRRRAGCPTAAGASGGSARWRRGARAACHRVGSADAGNRRRGCEREGGAGGAGGGKHGARPRSGGGGRPGAQETHRFEGAATAFEKGRARQVGCARVEGGAAPLCGDGDVAENTLPHIEQAAHPASFKKVQRGHCRCSMCVALQGTSPEAERATEGGEIRPASSLASDRFRFEPHPFCFTEEVGMAFHGGLAMMARARVLKGDVD